MLNFIKGFFIFFILCVNVSVYAQGHYLYYKLNGANHEYVILLRNYGEKTEPVDTAYRQQNGAYAFMGIERYAPGLYTIYFDDTLYTEVVINNESIVLESDKDNVLMGMQVKSSLENRILFNYWKYAILVKDSIARVNYIMQRELSKNGNKESEKVKQMRNEMDAMGDRLFEQVIKSTELYPDALTPKLLMAYQMPDYRRFLSNPDNTPYANEREFYKLHFFDYIDFSDERLLNSKVFFVAISDYMQNFSEPASTKKYIALVDRIMNQAKANDRVYQYCLNLFIRSFDNTIWEDVFAYVIDTYLPQLPEATLKAQKGIFDYYRAKSQAIKRLKPGKEAPDFTMNDTLGNKVQMHKIKAKVKMLIFYSSDCPHCAEAMPDLKELYNQYHSAGVEFIGVAIDDDDSIWRKDIRDHQLPWISVSDLQGMVSPVVETYNVWMTPTMIILDKKNIIMKKPVSVDEIHATFLQLLYE